MGVHVEEARQQRLACTVDRFRTRRQRVAAIRPHRFDAVPFHDNDLILADGGVLRIEYANVANGQRVLPACAPAARPDREDAFRRPPARPLRASAMASSKPFANRSETAGIGEEFVVFVEPDRFPG